MASRRKAKKKHVESLIFENHYEALAMNKSFDENKRIEILNRKYTMPPFFTFARKAWIAKVKREILFRKFKELKNG